MDTAADEIERLRAREAGLKTALKKARAGFQFYVDEHNLAGRLQKAHTNQIMVDMCTAALAKTEIEG
jgi:hypothetical protein